MNRALLLFFSLILSCSLCSAQTVVDTEAKALVKLPDSVQVAVDTSLLRPVSKDSVSRIPLEYLGWKLDLSKPLPRQLLSHHPYFNLYGTPVVLRSNLMNIEGKEDVFFALVALLLLFASFKMVFPKYVADLFRVFFRTTLKQRQIREQLVQTPLPSLLLNGFFVMTGGLYIDFLLHHFHLLPVANFWLLFLYCVLGLCMIYFVKFVWLKFAGWLFGLKEAADSYIFIVFIINKVIGVFLLPILVLVAFMDASTQLVAFILSWCGIGALLLYRFILTFAAIRNQVKFNPFHFFLYLCAFEIAPLLLIYKLLLFFFR